MWLFSYKFQGIRKWHRLFHSQRFNYEEAIVTLNLMQSKLNFPQKKRCQFPINEPNRLLSVLLRYGLRIEHLKKQLSVIHVSGSKGKGSTCAYCENILLLSGFKTGLFTSPHLISVRERIRINGTPLSPERFASLFWDLRWKLDRSIAKVDKFEDHDKINYFTFLTIMAVRAFVEEQVDVAILEVGIGGEYDATNAFDNTAVVGLTSLDYDHIEILGGTIEEIAWQKAGIIKRESIVICSSDQPIAALKIISRRAEERKAFLFVAPHLDEYAIPRIDLKLGIGGPAQASNASLAVQLANAWMNPRFYRATTASLAEGGVCESYLIKKASAFEMPSETVRALSFCRWPGRAQIFHYSSTLVYYLDGAHSSESMRHCVAWFRQSTSNLSDKFKKALIFNITGGRDGRRLMEFFLTEEFDYVFFCCNRLAKSNNYNSENVNLYSTEDEEYERIVLYRQWWLELHHDDNEKVRLFRNVVEAHNYTRNLSSMSQEVKLHVLVTGSLYLVSGFLQLLDPDLRRSQKVF